MQSPLKGEAGWSGHSIRTSVDETRSLKRRRGRNVDVIGGLPTPQSKSMLPTPQTLRCPAKSTSSDNQHTQSQLPTPQTQRHRWRSSPHSTRHGSTSPPSPSGHTTFYLASNTVRSEASVSRRRPGLMFAQKMEMLSVAGPSRGVGVGMGGHRMITQSKVDQVKDEIRDENPFLVSESTEKNWEKVTGLASPGAIASVSPGESHMDSANADSDSLSPRPSCKRPSLLEAGSGLLSPPPTKHAPRISLDGKPHTRVQASSRPKPSQPSEQYLRMLDMDHNPFLAQPGESSSRVPGPIIDEDRPTVTYIFRGAKRVFANPLWSKKLPFPPADLNPDDEDFEPHPLPKPKLLWPQGPSPSKKIDVGALKRSRGHRERTPSPTHGASSPPSSPIATPTISRRFAGTSLSSDSPNPLGIGHHAFTDEEDFVEEDAEGESDDEFRPIKEEAELPVRRGLLFGKVGMKRDRDAEDDRSGKKIKGAEGS